MLEMEPADTFNLTLRGYQKQALMYVHPTYSFSFLSIQHSFVQVDVLNGKWFNVCSGNYVDAPVVERVSKMKYSFTNMTSHLLRYVFPPESFDGIIDLSADEKTFYFNPYSGELSLQFPKVETKCRGGILA